MAADVSIVVKAVTSNAVAGFKKVGDSIEKATASAKRFDKTQLKAFGASARTGANRAAGIGGAAVTGAAVYGVKKSMDLNRALTKSFTMLDSELQRNQTKKAIRDISGEIGIAEEKLATGGFNIISAGKFDKYKELLTASAQLAATTSSEVETLTGGISKAANIFGMKAGDIADGFFTMNKAAMAELPEIAEMVGKVGSSFNLLGKKGSQFQEMAGLFSALTTLGTNPAEATTGMASIMKLSTDLGFAERSKKKFRERLSPSAGIEEFVSKLATITMDELSALVPDDVAKQQLIKLVSNTKILNEKMVQTANMYGSNAKALEILSGQSSQKMDIAMNKFNIAMTKFGEELTPVLVSDVIPRFISAMETATPALISLAKLAGVAATGAAELVSGSTTGQLMDAVAANRENYQRGFGFPQDVATKESIARDKALNDKGIFYIPYDPRAAKEQTAALKSIHRDSQ